MRKTKIICTLGPASESENTLREMIKAGMNVARFNFSHGSHEEHQKRLDVVKKLRKELDVPLATLLDTKGPEIRLGKLKDGKAVLQEGNPFVLTTEDLLGDDTIASITFKDLPRDVSKGDHILIDDGLIELLVEKVEDTRISCVVLNGGPISDRKGVNVPNVDLSMPYLSDKDRDDIRFGIKAGFDFIAASFTRCAQDILQIREILEENGCNTIKIIAKIENAQGVNNIDEILRVSDGIMIARGDMGVEIPLEDVPVIQKMLIQRVYTSGKYVITATQMLDSMMNHPRPTRAEATDVANAIYDGTTGIMLSGCCRKISGGGSSTIMLSGETAAGKYPVEAVRSAKSSCTSRQVNCDKVKRLMQANIIAVAPSLKCSVSRSTFRNIDAFAVGRSVRRWRPLQLIQVSSPFLPAAQSDRRQSGCNSPLRTFIPSA